MVVHGDTHAGSFSMKFGEFVPVGVSRHDPVAHFVMPDVVGLDAFGNQIVAAFMPNQFPAIE